MKSRFKIGQKIIWIKCYFIEESGSTELKAKLKNGLLTGTVKEIDEDGDYFVTFDEDLRKFFKQINLPVKCIKENGYWKWNSNDIPYEIRPLNGI